MRFTAQQFTIIPFSMILFVKYSLRVCNEMNNKENDGDAQNLTSFKNKLRALSIKMLLIYFNKLLSIITN